MEEKVYIRGKPYDPNHLFLYYYDLFETYWFKRARIEEGQKLRPFDVNGDRVVSFEDIKGDKLKLVELAHFPGVKVLTANNASEAIQKIAGVKWRETVWKGKRAWEFDEKKPKSVYFRDGVSPQALENIRKINERETDVNGDGLPDRFEIDIGRSTWAHTIRIYWGLKDGGFSDWQIVKSFEWGTQIIAVEWTKNSEPDFHDFGSLTVQIAHTMWTTAMTWRLFAVNSRPYEER